MKFAEDQAEFWQQSEGAADTEDKSWEKSAKRTQMGLATAERAADCGAGGENTSCTSTTA